MPEFLRLASPTEALATLLSALPNRSPEAETIETSAALGRILAEDVYAPHPLPEFPRASVDGYAVRARDTFGASDSLPAYLTLVGEIAMGAPADLKLEPGQCALIHTGGMLPEGADAVVMLEHTQRLGTEIEVYRPTATGENVLKAGEDVQAGQLVLSRGTRLRPAEIGGCMALGLTHLRVARKPKVGIISTGDEVIPPDRPTRPGQVRDVNSYSLAALVEQAGGEAQQYGILPDRLEVLQEVAARAHAECDMVLITAGSSASVRDTTAEAIASLGAPGVLVHGVNIRPGKPTILAVCEGKPVLGLPGNPVSALVIGSLFAVPAIEKMLGVRPRPRPTVLARLAVNLASQAGREEWVPVRLVEQADERLGVRYRAEPIFGKSNFIFSLVAGDGLVRIAPEATGLSAGEVVEVLLF